MDVKQANTIDWAARGTRIIAANLSSMAADAAAVGKVMSEFVDFKIKTIPGREGTYRSAPVPDKQVLTVVKAPNPRAEAALKGSRTLSAIGTAVAVAGTAWDAYRLHQAHKTDNKLAMACYGMALVGDAVALAGQAHIKKDPETAAMTLLAGHAISGVAGILGNVMMTK